MNDELELIWKEVVVAYGIYVEGLRETTETLIQDSQGPGRYSNAARPVYKSVLLPLSQPARWWCFIMFLSKYGVALQVK
jgi:hypothetical protein